MAAPDRPTCATCRAWYSNGGGTMGECRRHAPQPWLSVNFPARWLETQHDGSCAEWIASAAAQSPDPPYTRAQVREMLERLAVEVAGMSNVFSDPAACHGWEMACECAAHLIRNAAAQH